MRYDFTEPYAIQKVEQAAGRAVTRWLIRRLRRWNGVVAAHVDWFAGRGLVASEPRVVRLPAPAPSDHDPIVVEISIPRSPA